jgi:hypothetical protein
MKKAKWMLVLAVICSVLIFGVNSSYAMSHAWSQGDLYWGSLSPTPGSAGFTITSTTISASGYVEAWDVNLKTLPLSVWPPNTAAFKTMMLGLPRSESVIAAPYAPNNLPTEVQGALSNNQGSSATATATSGYLNALSESFAYGSPDVVHTYSIAEVYQTFTVTSAGTLAFSVDYDIWAGATTDLRSKPYSDYAYANEHVYAEIVQDPDGSNQSKYADATTELFGGPKSGLTTDINNKLNVAGLDFEVGDTGYFHGYVVSETWTIPEPLSVTLLGLGLLGLGILSRSRKNS